MIHKPDPILCDLLGAGQLVLAYPQQPETPCKPRGGQQGQLEKCHDEAQNTAGPSEAGSGGEDEGHKQQHVPNSIRVIRHNMMQRG